MAPSRRTFLIRSTAAAAAVVLGVPTVAALFREKSYGSSIRHIWKSQRNGGRIWFGDVEILDDVRIVRTRFTRIV
jgi:hypothetical protein